MNYWIWPKPNHALCQSLFLEQKKWIFFNARAEIFSQNHKITELVILDKAFKTFKSNHQPTTTVVTTQWCLQVPYHQDFGIYPRLVTPPFPGQPDPMFYSPFHKEIFPRFPRFCPHGATHGSGRDVPFAPLCRQFCSSHPWCTYWGFLDVPTAGYKGKKWKYPKLKAFAEAELMFNK